MLGKIFSASLAAVVAAAVATAAMPEGTGGAPQHMVTFMTAEGQTTCPDGWSEAGHTIGRVILAVTDPDLRPKDHVPTTQGKSMADQTAPSHSHDFAIEADISAHGASGGQHSKREEIPNSGKLPTSGTTGTATTDLPFVQYLVCEKVAPPAADIFPFDTIGFFNSDECPPKWCPLTSANGRLVLGTQEGLQPGSGYNPPWSDGVVPNHHHDLSTDIKLKDETYHVWSGDKQLAGSGKQKVDGKSDDAGAIVPTVSLLACQRQYGSATSCSSDAEATPPAAPTTVAAGTTLPPGMLAYFPSDNCEELSNQSWVHAIATEGRFVVGIGGNGTQGHPMNDPLSSFTLPHSHQFKGKVNVPSAAHQLLADNIAHRNYGGHGEYHYKDQSEDASITIPIFVLTACSWWP